MKKDIQKAGFPIQNTTISNLIYTIRDKQIMLDSDLAVLYQVTTGNLNKAVSRNIDRFPDDFRFRLKDEEFKNLMFQNGISSLNVSHGGRRHNPYAFTEQGVAMLSAVLRSDVAVQVSIIIMNAFVEMRKFLISNKELFSRLDRVELKQIEYKIDSDKKFDEIFNYLASKTEVKQKIFFNGQIYDAFSFLIDLIKKAKKSLILVDNYVNTDTLNLLSKKNKSVDIVIITSNQVNLSQTDIDNFNRQYKNLTLRKSNDFHDRFLIIDSEEVYHIGASLKDAGKKTFAFSKMEKKSVETMINAIT